ncbi:signal peptidase II [Dongia mobilis]|uniref:Lipoprotein signal peptidase n=1 Tax=Dongia mobilis TaxID=578943 RepID=A0A4V3DEV6_9PROT|nr:signal peptidase II [Dongia mobilis]TDQ83200.1 signal peptidase II [Dongia mobilis]
MPLATHMRLAAPALFRNALVLAVLVILADQATKWWIMDVVMQPPRIIPLVALGNGGLNIVMAWNTGVSFSMLSDTGPLLLSSLAILVSLGLLVWLMRLPDRLPAYGIGLVIGGAIGNVIDRFRYEAVFDFIDFFVGEWHWPAFNMADTAITIGVVMLLADGLFQGGDRGKNTSRPEAD